MRHLQVSPDTDDGLRDRIVFPCGGRRYGIGCQAPGFTFVGVCRARAEARARTCRSLRGRAPAGYGRLDSEEAASARWPATATWANAARRAVKRRGRARP